MLADRDESTDDYFFDNIWNAGFRWGVAFGVLGTGIVMAVAVAALSIFGASP